MIAPHEDSRGRCRIIAYCCCQTKLSSQQIGDEAQIERSSTSAAEPWVASPRSRRALAVLGDAERCAGDD